MAVIADHVLSTISHIKRELQDAVTQCACFVETLERTHLYPALVDCTVPIKMGALSKRMQSLNRELYKYVLFYPQLEQEADEVDDVVEGLGERFLKWANRTTISVLEATERFSRSRSTIYRWIKSGRLTAQKERGRWVIAI